MAVIADIIAAADRMAQLEDGDRLTREAVEFARDALGLERVSIYLSEPEPSRVVMRGTWGTGDNGRTVDERGSVHACGTDDFESLRQLHQRGELWQYCGFDRATAGDESVDSGGGSTRPWLVVTPLIVARDVVGVMYNDTAISNAPFDAAKQTNLALFSSLLAAIAQSRLAGLPVQAAQQPITKNSRLIRRVVSMLDGDPRLTGESLAKQFCISPGHLARTFRQEMGTSLVDYRNHLRLDRFFALTQQGQRNLLESALEAGFGSYAQFHRVHRQVTGVAPRHYVPGVSHGDRHS